MSDSAPPPAAPPPSPPPAGGTPPSGVSEPWAKGWIKPDFTLDHSALERLPDHLKGIKEPMSRFKSFDDFAGAYANANMLASKKGLAPLPADAPDSVRAERKAHLDTLNGVPKEAKDYGVKRPDSIPAEFWDDKVAENYTSWAHKHSVSPSAVQELIATQSKAIEGNLAAQEQYKTQFFAGQQKAFEDQVRTENIPLDRANAMAERGAAALGLDFANEQDAGIFKNAKVRLMAMRHTAATSEDTTVRGNTNVTGGDPLQQANDIVQNPSNPLHAVYWNRDAKYSQDQNKAAVAKVMEFHRMAAAKKK